MDFRQHERFRTRFDVRIIDMKRDEPGVAGDMVDVSAAGVCVVTASRMDLGTVVRVEFSEGCLFGQVIHVTPDANRYRVGIEIFDVLLEKSDLARLVESALHPDAEDAPTEEARPVQL
ncbi:MAG: PilZ domain-containing protein [Acidobacteria bacterium]|nr:PilZ domain-containing protein [Acidobacteriota bacterium]